MGSAKAKDVAQLKSKFAQLQALAAKTKLPGASKKLAMIDQHLAVYSETEEVARILKEMLDDIESRLKIIDTVDEQAKKLVEDTGPRWLNGRKSLLSLPTSVTRQKKRCSMHSLSARSSTAKRRLHMQTTRMRRRPTRLSYRPSSARFTSSR